MGDSWARCFGSKARVGSTGQNDQSWHNFACTKVYMGLIDGGVEVEAREADLRTVAVWR
jgi:hypothetical protein